MARLDINTCRKRKNSNNRILYILTSEYFIIITADPLFKYFFKYISG